MRGRILKVPNLLDYILRQEPRRGVAGLADVSRDGCRWSDKGSYSAGILGQREAAVQDAHSCCSRAEVREEPLVNDRGSFSIGSVLA